MAGNMSQVSQVYSLQVVFGQSVSGLITARNVWLALLTADPTTNPASLAAALSSEITAGGYARQQVTGGTPSGTPPILSNNALLTYGPFTAAPGTIAYAALCSAQTGTVGDFLYRWQLTDSGGNPASKTPGVNDTLQIAVGSLTAQQS